MATGSSTIFAGRTRSQLTLPEAPIELSRSPLKDARHALKNRSKLELERCEAGEKESFGEDNMSLSLKQLGDKRSPSPSTATDRSRLKRFKPSFAGNDVENAISQKVTHSRHYSDSRIFANSRRKRSATTSKPKSSSSTSTRNQSPAVSPPKKARASSVPVLPSYHDFPHFDIRDIPTSPTRRPLPSWEPKLRIAPASLLPVTRPLEPILDEAGAEQEDSSQPPVGLHHTDSPVEERVPATPRPLDKLETPAFFLKPNNVVLSKSFASNSGQNVVGKQSNKITNETPAVDNGVKTSRSRLPRPTNATASSSKVGSHVMDRAASPPQAASSEYVDPAKQKRNAFTVLMASSEKDKTKAKEGAATNVHNPGLSTVRVMENGKASRRGLDVKGKGKLNMNTETTTSTIKGKMKPRTKIEVKPTLVPSIVPEDDEGITGDAMDISEAPAYPLQPLPNRNSPSPIDFHALPPRSSSPVISPDFDERVSGTDQAVSTIGDTEMKTEDEKIGLQQPSPREANGYVTVELHQIETNVVPRVPSPLFTEPPTTAPSPLFTEPSPREDEDPSATVTIDTEAPPIFINDSTSTSHNGDIPTKTTRGPKTSSARGHSKTRRQKARAPPYPSRTTRSNTSKVVATGVTIPTSDQGTKMVNTSGSERPVDDTDANQEDVAHIDTSSSFNNFVPSANTHLYGDPSDTQPLPIVQGDDSLSELSDLPDNFRDEEEPLKGDGGEDIEMGSPVLPDPASSRSKRKSTGSKVRTSPRRSLRTRHDIAHTDEPSSSSVLQLSGSPGNLGKSRLARSTGSTKKSSIPVPTTPAHRSSTYKHSAPKDTRPGSAPSSPTKTTKSYSMFSYVPVSKYIDSFFLGMFWLIFYLSASFDQF
ncbi:hypothetical protein EV361DRAFT_455303 [Lentinula raphanica]|nr:hypothetical protein EV361DRAFT_455303 [Lentinula raphanica]